MTRVTRQTTKTRCGVHATGHDAIPSGSSRGPFHLFACYQDMFARKEYRNVESEEEAARWIRTMQAAMPDARYVTDAEWRQILNNERFPRRGDVAGKPTGPRPDETPATLSPTVEVEVAASAPRPMNCELACSTRDVIDEIKRRHPADFERTDPFAGNPETHIESWPDWVLAARLAMALEQIKREI